MSIHHLIVFVFAGLAGCDKNKPPVVTLPTNLVTSITTTGGLVDVQATAEHANFYTVTFIRRDNLFSVFIIIKNISVLHS